MVEGEKRMRKNITLVKEEIPGRRKNEIRSEPMDDMGFLLWKSELYKELMTFWKALDDTMKEEY
jgi:hypothetical protein